MIPSGKSDYVKLRNDSANDSTIQNGNAMVGVPPFSGRLCCIKIGYYIFASIILFISLTPLLYIGSDIIMIYIYYNCDINQVKALSIVYILLVLNSMRCYFVIFGSTSDNSSIYSDVIFVKNLYRVIPFIGIPIANLIHDSIDECNCGDICQYICLELTSFILIIIVPFCQLYIVKRTFRELSHWLFIKIGTTTKTIDSLKDSISYYNDADIWKSKRHIHEKLQKYKQQFLLLKTCEFIFHCIPMTTLNIYIYYKYNNIFNNDGNNTSFNIDSFYTSLIVSGLSFIRFIVTFIRDGNEFKDILRPG